MSKQSTILLALVAVLALGFTYGLRADEPKPMPTPSHEPTATQPAEPTATQPAETGATVVEEEEAAAIGEALDTETRNIAEMAQRCAHLKTFVTALRAAGLLETLQAKGPLTVFAPSDEAFAKLPEGALEELLADKENLRIVVRHHMVPVFITDDTADRFATVKALDGSELRIDATHGVTVNGAKVVRSNILSNNGVIHVIDAVLLPEREAIPKAETEEEEEEPKEEEVEMEEMLEY